MGKRALALDFIVVAVMAVAENASRSQEQIGYKPAAGADQKKALLLKDFHPASMLHAGPLENLWSRTPGPG